MFTELFWVTVWDMVLALYFYYNILLLARLYQVYRHNKVASVLKKCVGVEDYYIIQRGVLVNRLLEDIQRIIGPCGSVLTGQDEL